MQLIGKLIKLLPLQTGKGKNGEWKKQDIIIESNDLIPKNICISIWGDKINADLLQIGNILKLNVDIESREYNNKWYTDIKAWKIQSPEDTSRQQYMSNHTFHSDDATGEDDVLNF
jgi:hypothetical protein